MMALAASSSSSRSFSPCPRGFRRRVRSHRWDQVAADVVLIAAFLLCARWLHRSLQAPAVG
jgi:hypothetical protein